MMMMMMMMMMIIIIIIINCEGPSWPNVGYWLGNGAGNLSDSKEER